LTIVGALALTGALLAVAAGLAKLVDPRSAVVAMQTVSLPSSSAAVRLGAVAEVGVGTLVVVSGSWLARLLLAVAYAGFSVFSIAVMRSEREVPCGCFGRDDVAPGWRHVSINVAFSIALAVSAVEGIPSAPSEMRASAMLGATTVVVCGLAAWLAARFLSGTPRAQGAHDG